MTAKKLTRRTVLRGAIDGVGVSIALPLLDCLLNTNGTAIAATGTPLPALFGTWFQNLGLNPGRWVPQTVGAKYENNVELKVFDPFKERINLFSGMRYFVEGRPLETHLTGGQIATTGGIPYGSDSGPSIDSIVADTIGKGTRFRSIEVSLSGSRHSWSKRSGSAVNPSEFSPAALYTRIFGPGFADPNAAEFAPDPMILARRSVLSAVTEQRQDLMRRLGTSDRTRMDEYFTAVREIEQQLTLEMQKPEPLAACTVPSPPEEAASGTVVDDAARNAKLFGRLLAHALACGQTRVFNVSLLSLQMRKRGSAMTWHMLTHEEPVDEQLGYQVESTWFINWANTVFADFLHALDSVREGPGTVLDRSVILWQTDHSDARVHSLDNLPLMTVGGAGGRLKTGMHIAAQGDPATRVGLTVQQALGVPVSVWGELSNGTSKTIGELMV